MSKTTPKPQTRPEHVGAVELVALADLYPNPENPRTISAAERKRLARSLTYDPSMLWARPVIARTDGMVLCGNQRLAAATELGWTHIPAVLAELTLAQQQEWTLRDNREFGEDDREALVALLMAMKDSGADIETAIRPEEAAKLLMGMGEQDEKAASADTIPEQYLVMVTCPDEASQAALLEQLTAEGHECRALMS